MDWGNELRKKYFSGQNKKDKSLEAGMLDVFREEEKGQLGWSRVAWQDMKSGRYGRAT